MSLDPKSLYQQQKLSELEELTEEHLGFAPLSDGLGFSKKIEKISDLVPDSAPSPHIPFAVAAGTAIPATFHNSIISPNTNNPSIAASNIRTANISMQEPGSPISTRSAAFFIDLLFVSIPFFLALRGNFSINELQTIFKMHTASLSLFYFCFVFSYFLLSESFGGQSLGKMLFHLRIVEDDKYQKPIGLGIAFARLCSFIFIVATLGLGFIFALWDSKSRPLHDKLTGSIVRSKR